MDKIAKLKSDARSIATSAASGILGIGGGVAAEYQIQRNKRSNSSTKGWKTRRTNAASSS